ncbi:OsmC family protein [Halomarina halobia]|uniref:OsmC family protein n=1 Tax=Halomarina halobia TaxID=3033386 RepID=A0ABD6AFF9_9EURY|nr:OsmC family protein [Halomarina sp. PSR21]
MNDREPFTAELRVSSEDTYKTATLRGKHELVADEPTWLPGGLAGHDDHPAPVDYLVMSLASCQVSVLVQCLERNGVDTYRIECNAVVDEYYRDDDHPEEMPPHTALRLGHITVEMVLTTTAAYRDQADQCLITYDQGCIVGQSLSGGIDYTPLTALEIVDSPLGTVDEQ